MDRNDANPERTPASGPDFALEIRDSFQAVLDALDAARADLLRDEQQEHAEDSSQSQSRHGHPTGDARFPQPPSTPASSTSDRALPVRRASSGTQAERPGPHRPTAADSPPTVGLRRADAPQAVVAEPPGLPSGLKAVPPPSAGKPPTASGPGPDAVAPTMAFPTPAPRQESGRSKGPGPGTDWSDVPRCPAVPFDQLATAPSQGTAPSVHAHRRKTSGRRRRFTHRRDLRVAGISGLGAASGLILASWLLTYHNAESATSSSPPGHVETPLPTSAAPKDPSPPTPGQPNRPQPSTPDPPLPEIPGTGLLRQGDSGHGVYELQVRLLQIAHIYDGGVINGRYDGEVRAAVTLFQKRYGVRGDESGVYGDNTRLALMLRTK